MAVCEHKRHAYNIYATCLWQTEVFYIVVPTTERMAVVGCALCTFDMHTNHSVFWGSKRTITTTIRERATATINRSYFRLQMRVLCFDGTIFNLNSRRVLVYVEGRFFFDTERVAFTCCAGLFLDLCTDFGVCCAWNVVLGFPYVGGNACSRII